MVRWEEWMAADLHDDAPRCRRMQNAILQLKRLSCCNTLLQLWQKKGKLFSEAIQPNRSRPTGARFEGSYERRPHATAGVTTATQRAHFCISELHNLFPPAGAPPSTGWAAIVLAVSVSVSEGVGQIFDRKWWFSFCVLRSMVFPFKRWKNMVTIEMRVCVLWGSVEFASFNAAIFLFVAYRIDYFIRRVRSYFQLRFIKIPIQHRL